MQQPIQSSGGSGGSGSASPYAREFQLLQERKRLSTWGITCYELHKPSGKLVFACFNDLYQCLDTGYNVRDLRFLVFLLIDVSNLLPPTVWHAVSHTTTDLSPVDSA